MSQKYGVYLLCTSNFNIKIEFNNGGFEPLKIVLIADLNLEGSRIADGT
jgi:hypothetical protein